jgi:hypothetical protein
VPVADDVEALVARVYPNLASGDWETMKSYALERAIVAPLNQMTDGVNELIQRQRSDVPAIQLLSVDRSINRDGKLGDLDDEVPVEVANPVLDSLPGMPKHRLVLKPGDILLVNRSMCQAAGLVNGTRCIFLEQRDHRTIDVLVPVVDQYTNTTSWERRSIHRITFRHTQKGALFYRFQFPVRLGYVMTINKSQSLTLKVVGLDLRTGVFAHGQLYVAISRVRRRAGLVVLPDPHMRMDGIHHTPNVVDFELLNAAGVVSANHMRVQDGPEASDDDYDWEQGYQLDGSGERSTLPEPSGESDKQPDVETHNQQLREEYEAYEAQREEADADFAAVEEAGYDAFLPPQSFENGGGDEHQHRYHQPSPLDSSQTIIDVSGEGFHCGPRALALSRFGSSDSHTILRMHVCDFIESCPLLYEGEIRADRTGWTVAHYVDHMRGPVFTDAIFMQACSDFWEARIVIWRGFTGEYVEYVPRTIPNLSNIDTITIQQVNNNHYRAVMPA